jgi:hypothetical protein
VIHDFGFDPIPDLNIVRPAWAAWSAPKPCAAAISADHVIGAREDCWGQLDAPN